ncbi:MAG: hypothetical protein ACJAZ0_003246 [Halioglobus sp.]
MPGWQALYTELKEFGFVVITVALDKNAEEAIPWIEIAKPEHPSLIDSKHLVADLYNMVNVPTVVWIDESGKIVRPNDVAFANNTWQEFTGLDSDIHKQAVREWVKNGTVELTNNRAKALQSLPSQEHQLARAEFGVARWLWGQGRTDAANIHFAKADILAPHDFTIRRGSMPMRDIDPMGQEFFDMMQQWSDAGNEWYQPLPDS